MLQQSLTPGTLSGILSSSSTAMLCCACVVTVRVCCRLGRRVSARVMITNLSDDYVKDYKKLYSVGDLVKGKILK